MNRFLGVEPLSVEGWLCISIAFALFLALSVAMSRIFDRLFGKAHEA